MSKEYFNTQYFNVDPKRFGGRNLKNGESGSYSWKIVQKCVSIPIFLIHFRLLKSSFIVILLRKSASFRAKFLSHLFLR